MGTWGTGPFDNDVAEDWLAQLSEQGPSFIDFTLLDVEYHDGDECCAAIAAAEGIDSGTLYDWLFTHLQAPMMTTMFSLLSFFIASAAYRAFRARTIQATLLLGTAIIVMLGRIPIGQAIYAGLPDIANWIMSVPNTAVQRGIIIGAALGGASTALRIILGLDRTYMGRG